MVGLFHSILFKPLYNGLVFLVTLMPFHDLGIAIALLTLLVRAILLPFSHGSIVAQKKMRTINPEVAQIKADYAHDAQEQNKRIMELYSKHGINPFSSCLAFAIQIPVILALYWVFRGLAAGINPSDLYTFIGDPVAIHTQFLGLFDLTKPSVILSLVAAGVQYFQIKLSLPPSADAGVASADVKKDFSEAMTSQMKYVLPVIVFLVSYRISAAIALYWTVSNLFSVGHELVVQRQVARIQQSA